MSRVFLHGSGAVSPAGWGTRQLWQALSAGQPLPVQSMSRPGWEKPLTVRAVPGPAIRPAFLTHPRLRRSGAMSQHVVAAAVEALGNDIPAVEAGNIRLGIIVCMMAGGVTYSRRFFEEVLRDPGTASPLIFPETVFNAPASHLGAYLGAKTINYTLVGDEGTYLQALAVGAGWLAEDQVDGCLVVGAEEVDWIVADAVRHFHRSAVYTGGAGAIYLKSVSGTVELTAIGDAFIYTSERPRMKAAAEMRAQFGLGATDELLCDSELPNCSVWRDWTGERLTPKAVLGEGFLAGAAWQCVAAYEALISSQVRAVTVSVVGANQQAIGARFGRMQ